MNDAVNLMLLNVRMAGMKSEEPCLRCREYILNNGACIGNELRKKLDKPVYHPLYDCFLPSEKKESVKIDVVRFMDEGEAEEELRGTCFERSEE